MCVPDAHVPVHGSASLRFVPLSVLRFLFLWMSPQTVSAPSHAPAHIRYNYPQTGRFRPAQMQTAASSRDRENNGHVIPQSQFRQTCPDNPLRSSACGYPDHLSVHPESVHSAPPSIHAADSDAFSPHRKVFRSAHTAPAEEIKTYPASQTQRSVHLRYAHIQPYRGYNRSHGPVDPYMQCPPMDHFPIPVNSSRFLRSVLQRLLHDPAVSAPRSASSSLSFHTHFPR